MYFIRDWLFPFDGIEKLCADLGVLYAYRVPPWKQKAILQSLTFEEEKNSIKT